MRRRPSHAAGVVLAAAVAVAGCSRGGSANTSHPVPDAAQSTGTVSDSQRAAEQTRLATAFAGQIAGSVPRLRGQETLAAAPTGLVQPDEVLGVPDLITQSRYWTVPGTPLQVYRALKRSRAARYRLTGYGAPGRGSNGPGRAFLSYDSVPAPGYVQEADVHVEIARYGTRRSVIASFGEVDPHPIRTGVETIAVPGATGTYRWPRIVRGKVVGHRTATLPAAQVRVLVTQADRAPVADAPDGCFGAIQLRGDVLTVYLHAGGHSWTLVYPGTSCDDIAVSRDGHPLPALSPTRQLRHQLEVLEHDDGTITGKLLEVGGPPGAQPAPESGIVSATSDGHTVATAHPRRDGHFALETQPGRYTLSATASHYRVNGSRGRCSADHPVSIATGVTTHVNVYCQRR